MFTNLFSKIESEINAVIQQMQSQSALPENSTFLELKTKKASLEKLAHEYLLLEGRYKELAGLNGIY